MKQMLLILVSAAAIARGADESALRAAIAKSLPLLERSSVVAIEERSNCFTCHHTGLPLMTFIAAREHGFGVDEANIKTQLQFTADFLAKGRTNYLQGKGQGGAAFSAGSALWALKQGGWKADASTQAVVDYLLGHQKEQIFWKPPSVRPPSEESAFSATWFAIEGIRPFATDAQQARMKERIEAAREWLIQSTPMNTEDRVFRLLALRAVGAGTKDAVADLSRTQNADGGWSQLETMGTDAYATATALFALSRGGGLPTSDARLQRGLDWLLRAQQTDGSWHVVSRSKPFQKYFESGYPHGKDQFISITAACWATTVLIEALPPASKDITFNSNLDGTEQRYAELMPPGFDATKPHDIVIALHGHGSDRWQFINDQRGECRGLRDVAAKHDLIFVSPDYRAKTSWMGPTAEADLLQIITEVKKRHRVNRVFIAGGSMGGTSALIFATLHPELIAGVCALNPTANLVEYAGFKDAIDTSYGSAEERQKRSPELHAERLTMPVALTTGGKDTTVPPESTLRLAKKLKRVLSIHHETGGHSTSYDDTVKAMEWVLGGRG